MRHLRIVLVALAIGAWAAGPLPHAAAQTAPTYQSSSPSKGEMLDHPPDEVTITFDQPLDDSSWVNVFDECGNEVDGGPATVNVNELHVKIADKPAGMYEVVYKAVGLAGATGSSGSSFDFMVHHGETCDGGSAHHHHGGGGMHHHGGHGGHHSGHEGMDHSGHEGMDGMDHSGHSGMSGMAGMDHSGHSMRSMDGMDHGMHGGHAEGHHHHHGGSVPVRPAQPPPLASGNGTVPVGADGEAVLVGLGLALAVGVLGGWLLRMSSTLAGV